MKQHIFGLMIFGTIFALTAIGFAYFYTPQIPQIEEITRPEINNERPPSCLPKLKNYISSEVESVQYDENQQKMIAKIKLKWSGSGNAPENVFWRIHLLNSENELKNIPDKKGVLENFLKNGSETEVTLEYNSNFSVDELENLYAFIDVSTNDTFEDRFSRSEGLTKSHQVLFVHSK